MFLPQRAAECPKVAALAVLCGRKEGKEKAVLRVGIRYTTNLFSMIARQRGYLAAGMILGRLGIAEIRKFPRFVPLALRAKGRPVGEYPQMYSAAIVEGLASLGVELKEHTIDSAAFWAHVRAYRYPHYYAAGPLDDGGAREQKLLEYFVTLELLDIQPTDVVVDVASEWSIFPDMLRKLVGATVYRQDLIYKSGVHKDRIGGSAAHMPIPNEFADNLVLHNAFEHFEGMADRDFLIEAWRVLKPGGALCILPLFMAEQHSIVTDPLVVRRRDIAWDEEARVIELPGWHNRFGRHYDALALQRRILAMERRFVPTIYHLVNVREVHPRAYLHFALVLRKPTRYALTNADAAPVDTGEKETAGSSGRNGAEVNLIPR